MPRFAPFHTAMFSTANTGRVALCAFAAATLAGTIAAHAEDLVVRYDQAQLLRLPKPISEVIVGNSSIADVTIQGANMLVITGKTFGITNIIALDADRNVIQDQRIMVERDSAVVNLHRGTGRQTYSCTPYCHPNLTIGDDQTFFKGVEGQNTSKVGFSEKNTDSDKGSQ